MCIGVWVSKQSRNGNQIHRRRCKLELAYACASRSECSSVMGIPYAWMGQMHPQAKRRSSCMIGTLHAVLKLRLLSGQAHAVALEGGRRVCLLQHLDNVDYKRKNSNRTPNNSCKPSSLQRLWTRRLLWSKVVFSDSPELTLPRRTRSASSFSDRTRARCSCSRPSFSCAYYTCQSSSTGVPSSPVTC